MTNIIDGLGGEEMNQPGSQVSQIWITGSLTSDSQISGANVYGGTAVEGVAVSNTDGLLKSVAIGSPSSVYGASIQAGSGTLSADSGLWIVFPTAYANRPIVHVTNWTSVSTDVNVLIGSLNAGSAWIEGETASDEFGWIAIGL